MKKQLARLLLLSVAYCLLPAGCCPLYGQITPEQEKQLFSRIDQVFGEVSKIMGMKIRRPVPRAVISREKIHEYIEKRMAEALSPDDIRAQEIVLKKFGFVGQDFDLKSQTVDLLTEQAAAFYDFKQKKLFLASWTPVSMQDVALVHELAHALADQHFNLEKFINKSGEDDDAATARGAVVEGQASWVMTEYMLRQMGQSLRDTPRLAESTVEQTAEAAKQFPVFGAAPLYVQQTMMFPYTQGTLFQQAVVQKLGVEGCAEAFRRPPVSSQQVLHPELYFARSAPSKPPLPHAPLPSGYKKLAEGTLGELDHQILLRQFAGEEEARELAPRWKGSRYAIWENKKEKRAVLSYAVEWASEADAARYFADYRKVCQKKWKRFEATDEMSGTGDDGRFVWSLHGAVFTSVEGMP
ncbi:MAG: hypothetical protein HY238_03720 [Acidobacteria bacterium]|nr:hypothetical protein [Acidobacteriota bacterium]